MQPSDFWAGKNVFITGASSGLGAALAEYIATRGARVGLIARRAAELERVATRLRALPGAPAVGVALGDVRSAAHIQAAVVALEQSVGPCDVLVANAGIHRATPGDQFDVAAVQDVIATNLAGVVNTLGAVLPGMVQRRRGHVVAVASVAALQGLPDSGAYSASKAGVVALMEGLRIDLARVGVRVTTVCPGYIDTPMVAANPHKFFVLSPPEAARRTARAIERNRAECWFPWPTLLLARLGRLLPRRWYTRLMARAPAPRRRRGRGGRPPA
jgi:short-subunit dehydrogenase